MTAATLVDGVTTYLSKDGRLRIRIARVSGVVAEATRRHALSPYARYALGRGLGAVALMPMSWKDADRVSVQWAGVGSIGHVIAEARKGGSLRGYVKHPQAEAPRAFTTTTRPNTIGYDARGVVAVVKQAEGGQHTQGQVSLHDGSIDGDLVQWFDRSEQVPTRLRVDVGDDAVVGVLLQALPGDKGDSADPAALVDLGGFPSLTPLSDGEIIDAVSPDARLLEQGAVRFECPCSRERIATALCMLSEQDLLEMLAVDHGAEVTCDFCAEVYTFADVDLTAWIDTKYAGEDG